MLSFCNVDGACVRCVRRKWSSIPPARCKAANFGGKSYGVSEGFVDSREEERGKKSVVSLERDFRVWKSSLLDMEAEIRERSR